MFSLSVHSRLLLSACLAALVVSVVVSPAQAVTIGTVTTPDSTVYVTPGNLNGWTPNGFVDLLPGDPTTRGVSQSFVDTTTAPGTDNGAWEYTADLTAFNDNAYYVLTNNGLAGRLVSDWTGFEYRSLQEKSHIHHAVITFQIDRDGDLQTNDLTTIRFESAWLAASAGIGTISANEWHTYGIDNTSTKFLDAINVSVPVQTRYQSIAELFLPEAEKTGINMGGAVTIPSTAVFKTINIHSGYSFGFGTFTEQVDYIQFTFASDGTTRYDFGTESLVSNNVVPEPATAGLTLLAISALALRRRRRA